MAASRCLPSAHLDKRFTGSQQRGCLGPCADENVAQCGILHVTASDPEHARWRATLIEQPDEIVIFGDHHIGGGPRRRENRRIVSLMEPERVYVYRVDPEFT